MKNTNQPVNNTHYFSITLTYLLFCLIIFSSTYTRAQTNSDNSEKEFSTKPEDVNFFLISDAGSSKKPEMPLVFQSVRAKFELADTNDFLLFLGDNVPKNGIEDEDDKDAKLARQILQNQLEIAKEFPGTVYFLPGPDDWGNGLEGLEKQEDMVDDALGDHSFLPKNGCPFEEIEVSDELVILMIDSYWYVTDWNKYPKLNVDCDITSRTKFWTEFNDKVGDHQDKTIVVAMHHPAFTNGRRTAHFTPKLNFQTDFLRQTDGPLRRDQAFTLYRELSKRVQTSLRGHGKGIIVSGHEHNLQFIEKKEVKQIISGSAAEAKRTKIEPDRYGYDGKGFAIVQLKANNQQVCYFNERGNLLEQIEFRKFTDEGIPEYGSPEDEMVTATIYSDELFEKLPDNKFIHGKHYREYYNKKFQFPVANLDTLYGGLKPLKTGGGNQTVSVRLVDNQGREYNMRRLRKNPAQFYQKRVLPTSYIEDRVKGTFPETYLYDFFTTAHPFGFLTVPLLAKASELYHTNPEVFYVPKQKALKEYNLEHGNELYMIEERPEENWINHDSFGNPDDIDSTDDIIEDFLSDEETSIDTDQFIRTRLFDMFLGDWDRHSDQFQWSIFEDDEKEVYRAIPRDRDQVFSKFDGLFVKTTTHVVPLLRQMQSLDNDIDNLKYFNIVSYRYDLALIQNTSQEQWKKEAAFLEKNLTDEVIEQAFDQLPEEIREDQHSLSIQSKLKKRRENLVSWAKEYYNILSKHALVTATNKDDFIDVSSEENGEVLVEIFRNKDGERDAQFVKHRFHPDQTKEIWIYALDDDDQITIRGNRSPIQIMVVGGAGHDRYDLENKSNIRIYDHKSKENTFENKVSKRWITDDYAANTFDVLKFQQDVWQTLPAVDFDPDGGFQPGLTSKYKVNKFSHYEPTSIHTFQAKFYSATNGFAVGYHGYYKDLLKNLHSGLSVNYTTPFYTNNFFGYGNNTEFNQDLDFDYYRVRQSLFQVEPKIIKDFPSFGNVNISVPVERVDIDDNENRLVQTYFGPADQQLDEQWFYGVNVGTFYENTNKAKIPAVGVQLAMNAGIKQNIQEEDQMFYYVKPELAINYPIVRSNRLVFASKAHADFQFTDTVIPFYYAASYGGDYGLRGYRDQRFTADNGFYHSSDLRYELFDLSSFIGGTKLGVFGGYDYGKLWMDNNTTNLSYIPNDAFTAKFQQSYGGGLFFKGGSSLVIRTSYFSSDDGGRFSAGLGYDF